MGGAVSGLTKAKLLKRLDKAAKAVEREISANAQGGKFASGLANEGWAGGYQQALRDVDALHAYLVNAHNR